MESMLDKYLEILKYRGVPEWFNKYKLVPSLVRLKKVGYFCGMNYASKNIYDFQENISRYDHSLSVAFLTWKLTGDIKATLAGLFHDISTPCFSHVIDYMNKDYANQESTEEKTGDIIRGDKYLLSCLELDGIDVSEIVDFKRYSIVDLERPMLCADRLDGIILTGLFWTKSINIDDVKKIINDLIIIENEDKVKEIGFKNEDIARLVMDTGKLIDRYCHSKEDNYMMELLSKITRRAIDIGIISYDSLFILDEDEVINRFDNSNDEIIRRDMDIFRNIKLDDILELDLPYIKARKLNPLVLNGRLK